MTKLRIEPLTPERFVDLEQVFASRGCSVARKCWCMYYRRSGGSSLPHGATAQASRAEFKTLVDAGQHTGILAYRGEEPVGWLSFGPREDFTKLARSPVMKPVDEQPVWSIICFVVPSPERGQGVAHALLRGAIQFSRRQGVKLLEGYPVDKAERTDDQNMWFGAKSMFDAAGFEEVARRKPERPIVRLKPA